ncbi:hypothetical protein ASD53_14215 [Lysobacter sp. Root559]|nr:hypothetical protein ASD53_14215 [Lysobacter sp. Root559]
MFGPLPMNGSQPLIPPADPPAGMAAGTAPALKSAPLPPSPRLAPRPQARRANRACAQASGCAEPARSRTRRLSGRC